MSEKSDQKSGEPLDVGRWTLDAGRSHRASSESETERPTSNVQRPTSKEAQFSTLATPSEPPTTSLPAVAIVGCGAMTAVGGDLQGLRAALLANASGLRPDARFDSPRFQSN